MHAASVNPEPGSNSPKMHSLAAVTCSEGLTARTSLSRISCHSSIVKVQRPGHDGPRRRAPSMDSAALTVKPDEPVPDGASDPAAGPERRHGGEWYGPARIGVKPGPDRLRSSRLG